jgi:hypothetical protein
VRQQAVTADTLRADSARAFVQRFYVWYLATKAQQGSPYDSLLAACRSVLGDSLLKALEADIAAQRADTIPEIASLSAEADVFLNSQDPTDPSYDLTGALVRYHAQEGTPAAADSVRRDSSRNGTA